MRKRSGEDFDERVNVNYNMATMFLNNFLKGKRNR